MEHTEFGGCPGARVIDSREKKEKDKTKEDVRLSSELRQWPIQFHLVPVNAPYFDDGTLLLAADCVPFACANFHKDFLSGKPVIIGCPKLDDASFYTEKLTEILKANDIKDVIVVNMEVPCCFGFQALTGEAIDNSGKDIKLTQNIISVGGELIQ